MGFFDGFFGPPKHPNEKAIATQAAMLQQRHGEPARRYQAVDQLVAWGTPEAVDALLLRFTVDVASETSDEDEKEYVADLIGEKIGESAVPSLERYLRQQEQVGWPLRVLSKLLPPDDFRTRVTSILSTFDTHYDRAPERKVEMIHSLMEHAKEPEVADAVRPFMADTNDTVRIAAQELLARSGRDQDAEALVEALVDSEDRPRVKSALLVALMDRAGAIAGRRAEVEPLLPEGYYLTREGTLKRLGK